MANIQTQSYTCTPSSLLDSSPCLSCLSEKELIATLVAILANAQSETAAEALNNSSCFTCMSKKQMLQALVTIFGNEFLGERVTIDEIIADLSCLVCAPEQQLLAALLRQICNLNFAPIL